MKREPITIAGLDFTGETFVTQLKASQRILWREVCIESNELMIPSLLHHCIVDGNGSRIKTLDEWDEWGGEHFGAFADAFHECTKMIGTVEAAKKK